MDEIEDNFIGEESSQEANSKEGSRNSSKDKEVNDFRQVRPTRHRYDEFNSDFDNKRFRRKDDFEELKVLPNADPNTDI